jgi:O-antigen/teichoic acid export membrane protein
MLRHPYSVGLRENIKNTLFTRVFLLSVGLFSSMVYARILGPAQLGQGVLLLLFPPILVKFLNFGFIGSLPYFVGQEPENQKQYIGAAFTFGVFLSIVVTGLLLITAPKLNTWYYKDSVSTELLTFALLITPLHVALFSFTVATRALNKIKELNQIRDVYQAILRFGLVLLFLWYFDWGVWGYILMEFAVHLVLIFLLGKVLYQEGVLSFHWSRDIAKTMLSYGVRGYWSSVSGKLSLKLDQLVAGAFLTDTQVGIYAISLQLANRLTTISSIVSFPLLPSLSRATLEEASRITSKILNLLLIPMVLGIIAAIGLGDFFIEFAYGASYSDSYIPFIALCIATLPTGWTSIIGIYFFATNRPEVRSVEKMINLCLKALFLFSLVPTFGIIGAAVGTLCVEALLFIIMYRYYKHNGGQTGQSILSLNLQPIKDELRLLRNRKK